LLCDCIQIGGSMASTTVGESVRNYQTALHQALDRLSPDAVGRVAQEILAAHDREARIFVFGNGGSAATADHMVCDLGKNTAVGAEPQLRCHSLVANTSLITALANDLGYEAIFAQQLRQAHVHARDLVIAISASGNSPNVLAGVATAMDAGARTVAITGLGGGRLAPIVDVALVVPSDCMEIVEDVHLMVNHAITISVRAAFHERLLVPA
jgi:D-sedoheptulose 7-phosphate isomerase